MLDPLKNLLRRLYHVVFYGPAQRAIRRMIDDGLPAELVPAFRYLAQPSIAASDKRLLAPIRRFRVALRHRTDPPLGAVVSSEAEANSGNPQSMNPRGRPRLRPIPWKTLA